MSAIPSPPLPTPPRSTPRSLPLAEPVVLPPPFPLVAAHFAAGLAWATAGAAGLAVVAPVLAHGGFLDPRVLALTHCFTLGFLTTVITGVLYQIFPGMLGIACRSNRVAWFSLVAQVIGTALLVCGLLLGARWLQSSGWAALFAATYGVAWNLFPQRRRAPHNRLIGLHISYAHVGFGFAMFIGLARIGDAMGWWTTPRLELLAAHFQFAALGYGTLTAIGIGSRMLPMFLGAPPTSARPFRWTHQAVLSGTVVFAAGVIGHWPGVAWIGALLMIIPVAVFLRQAIGWFRRRADRPLDPAVAFIALSLVALGAAAPLGLVALWRGLRAPGLLAAYVVTVLLPWLGGIILGVSYRILPALTRQHLTRRGAANPLAPTAPLLRPRLGWSAWLGFGLGSAVLVVALITGHGMMARSGACLSAIGIGLTLAHHLLMGRSFRPARPSREDGNSAAGKREDS
jgi:hypothetical protein